MAEIGKRNTKTEGARGLFPHPLEPYPKLIINVALTGVIPMRADSPHVPLEPDEVVEDALACTEAGAAIVHVHARDGDGIPTYDRDIFAQIIAGIRKSRSDVIICATTSGRRSGAFEQRAAVLELDGSAKPDMASLTTGSLNFPDGPSVNAPDMIIQIAETMLAKGIKPELEILDLGMVNSAKLLIKKGLVPAPRYCNILLGGAHTAPATMLALCALVHDLPPDSVWSACGLGRFQLKMNAAAILMGGHVRVGLEDNLYYDQERRTLATNVMLVERVARIAAELERGIASPTEARAMLGLV